MGRSQVQVSLQRPVFMNNEPIKVKLSASVPSREVNDVKVHVVQDVQVCYIIRVRWVDGALVCFCTR